MIFVGIFLRFAAFFARHRGPFPWNPNEMSDYRLYAANLIMHHSFSYHWPIPSTYRLPFYPLLLVPFMKHLDLFLFIQTLLSIGTMIMIWRFTRSRIALIPLAFDLPSAQDAGAALTANTVFTFLIVWAFIKAWENKSSWLPWGLAAITRTHGFIIPLGLGIWIALVFPFVWIVRNGLNAHEWRLSDSSSYYTICLAEQITHKPILRYEQDPFEPMDPQKLINAKRLIVSHPMALLSFVAQGSFKFFFATNSEYLLDWLGISRETAWNTSGAVTGAGTLKLLKNHIWLIVPTAFLTLMYCVAYVCFLCGLFQLAWDDRWREFWMLFWTSLCLWLPAVLVAGSPHYRICLMPFICIGAWIFSEGAQC